MPNPKGVSTVEGAIRHVGLKPGDPVYLAFSCGDYWEGESVIIPRGQLGVVKDVYRRQDTLWMVDINLENSPGRPMLTYALEDARKLLTPTKPPPPPPATRYEHLLADTFGDLG